RPEPEVRKDAAAGSHFAEPHDLAHSIIDDVDRSAERSTFEDCVERNGARLVHGDALRELGEDPAIGSVLAGADEHLDRAGLRHEDATRDGAPLHDGGETDQPTSVQRRRTEPGERAARRRRVALGDDLPSLAARLQVDRLDALASAADDREKRDLASVVDRWSIEIRESP